MQKNALVLCWFFNNFEAGPPFGLPSRPRHGVVQASRLQFAKFLGMGDTGMHTIPGPGIEI
jgi:hypothetical protein